LVIDSGFYLIATRYILFAAEILLKDIEIRSTGNCQIMTQLTPARTHESYSARKKKKSKTFILSAILQVLQLICIVTICKFSMLLAGSQAL
jgi:hypothetical protein